jgi:SAM-dependent methyltransferase
MWRRPEGRIDPKAMIREVSVAELCRTADEYFRAIKDPTPQLGKPFTSTLSAPEECHKLGLVLAGLQLAKTMTVVDFGAGTCWLARFLHQLQCQVIAVDPSPAALELGRRLFREYPIVGEGIAEPQFLVFDGMTLSLPDASVDRILCFEAFHHVPNQGRVLAEFHRVLRPGGIAGFAESGPAHSQSPQAQSEMRQFRVLENDIDLAEIWPIAQRAGFTRGYAKPLLPIDYDLSIDEYAALLQGGRLPRGFPEQCVRALKASTVFFLGKGAPVLDSRGHLGLRHELSVAGRRFAAAPGRPLALGVTVRNTGEATWLAANVRGIGVVKVGGHLYDGQQTLLDLDFLRSEFDHDIHPGETVRQTISLRFTEAGRFELVLDLVSEGICWFENVGSHPQRVRIDVG